MVGDPGKDGLPDMATGINPDLSIDRRGGALKETRLLKTRRSQNLCSLVTTECIAIRDKGKIDELRSVGGTKRRNVDGVLPT